MFAVFSDPMGKEHHVRRTSGVPPLVVVVSVFLCLIMSLHAAFPRSIIDCIKNNDPSPFFSWSLISFVTLKSSFSVRRAAKFIYSNDNNRISVIVSMPLLLVCLTLCVLQCFLGPVLCGSRKERHMWTLQWSQGLPWLCESALIQLSLLLLACWHWWLLSGIFARRCRIAFRIEWLKPLSNLQVNKTS